ncbi:hypothetical protein KSF78_0000596 [Schistosoma japonicum]|nr:hypothetical protein KSF78_0000596 [Schistosoma japonicum]
MCIYGTNSRSNSDKLLCYGEDDDHKEYCSWVVDPNDWERFRWRMNKLPSVYNNRIGPQQAMCLHRPASLKTSETLTSRLWSPSINSIDESSSENIVDSSMNPSVNLQPRCISFSFRFFYPPVVEVGSVLEEFVKIPSLSVLKRQRG